MYKIVGNRYIEKRVNIRVEHIRHSKCRQEFLDRVKRNHELHAEAKAKAKESDDESDASKGDDEDDEEKESEWEDLGKDGKLKEALGVAVSTFNAQRSGQ